MNVPNNGEGRSAFLNRVFFKIRFLSKLFEDMRRGPFIPFVEQTQA
jgi:hypothetical protein